MVGWWFPTAPRLQVAATWSCGTAALPSAADTHAAAWTMQFGHELAGSLDSIASSDLRTLITTKDLKDIMDTTRSVGPLAASSSSGQLLPRSIEHAGLLRPRSAHSSQVQSQRPAKPAMPKARDTSSPSPPWHAHFRSRNAPCATCFL